MINYKLVRSRRKSLALEVNKEACVIVRAPVRVPEREIARFVESHAEWISRAQKRQMERRAAHPEPDEAKRAELQRHAREELPLKVRRYACLMGVRPAAVKITSARTRFGSCSGKNSICFSWRLMEYPDEAVDYVVVHELAHIVHKNHGPHFWALVARYMPDYKQRRALLR